VESRGDVVTPRVIAQLAKTSGTTLCTRCMDVIDVVAGRWHAADVDAADVAICDSCARHDDPTGWAQLTAWRRAARPTRRSAA
jgi:hypothetical protein